MNALKRAQIASRCRPILFNTEMVQAILEGRKTVTRRVIDRERIDRVLSSPCRKNLPDVTDKHMIEKLLLPRYEPGDILYVRETWQQVPTDPAFREPFYIYKADGKWNATWRPSIHMPKEAARIFLRVTGVSVERLQDITALGCIAEGIHYDPSVAVGEEFVVGMFSYLWDSTIRPVERKVYGWEANPWVWRYEFERVVI